ncbi:hypothetical protein GLU64_01795 [Nanohaloarchaea archaeon]|nr:hypothetical protein [Candidatus Nanohaloarchaea archaeon]
MNTTDNFTDEINFSKTLIAAFSVLLLTGMGAADTVKVGDGTDDNSTIGAAINYASSGDTIEVEDGTYNEMVLINKSSLTIKPAGDYRPVIHQDSNDWTAVHVNASDVTIEGFAIKNTNNDDSNRVRGIHGDKYSEGLTIRDVVVDGVEGPNQHPNRTAYGMTLSADSTTVEDSEVKNVNAAYFAAGIRLGGDSNRKVSNGTIDNVDISNIETTGNQSAGILLSSIASTEETEITNSKIEGLGNNAGTAGVSIGSTNGAATTPDLRIEGNDIKAATPLDNGAAIYVENISDSTTLSDLSQIAVSNNDFSGSDAGAANKALSLTLDASENYWGSAAGPQDSSNTYNDGSQGVIVGDDVDFTPWLDAAGGSNFAPVENTDTGTGYASIQAAVDDASSEDTIEVKEGTYNGNVVLDRGDSGQSDLTIKAAESASEKPFVWYDENDGTPTFAVDSEGATIEGLEIKRNNSGNVAQAVRVAADNVLLKDNVYDVGAGDRAVGIYTDSSGAAGNPAFGSEISSVELTGGEIISDANPSGAATVGVEVANTSGTDDVDTATFTQDSVSISDVDFTNSDARVHVWEFDYSDLSEDVGAIDSDSVKSGNTFDQLVTVDDPTISAIVSRTIQEAVSTAAEDAKVEVSSGTYNEDVKLGADGMTLEGAGEDSTTIVGQGDRPGTLFVSSDHPGIEVTGFRVEAGSSGNAVHLSTDSEITNVTFDDNTFVGDSSGVTAFVGGDHENIDFESNSLLSSSGNVSKHLYLGGQASYGSGDESATSAELEDDVVGNEFANYSANAIESEGQHVEVRDNRFVNSTESGTAVAVPGAIGDENSVNIDGENVAITENEFPANAGGVDADTAGDVQAQHNYWGAASGPEGSGADVTGDVDFEPWLLEADGTEYEETVSLTGGDWSLFSAPGSVDASKVVVDDGSNAKHFVYDTEASQFESVDSVDSNPLSATFVYASDASGVGLNYRDSSSASKDVAKGWNVISSTQEIKLRDALSPVAGSLNSFFAPADYNDGKLGGTYTNLGDRSSEVVDASNLDYLQSEFGSSQKVSRYDGYWVKASGSSTLELTVPQPE